jgi:hypothetical protein
MKTYGGNGCIDPRILDLELIGDKVSFTPLSLYPRYPLDRRLGRSRTDLDDMEK